MIPTPNPTADTTRWPLALALVGAIACGGGVSKPALPAPASDGSCVVLPPPPTASNFISAVFTSAVDPQHAPNPRTAAEQFVFGHAYEPLVRVNCRMDVSPGLAKSWTQVAGTDRWRFVLRENARFSNGDRVTANDVVASWRATGLSPEAVSARWMAGLATVVDDSTLEIQLRQIALAALGNPELGVAKQIANARWRVGTGAYRIQEVSAQTPLPARSTLMLEPVDANGFPRIAVSLTTPADGRDLVDGGADLIITNDRSLSAYRTTRPGVQSSLLTATTTWLLITQAPVARDSSATADASRTAAFRESLAQLAVRSLARPAAAARWFPSDSRCEPFLPPSSSTWRSGASTRIVYRRDEPTAQALAERVVALASSGDAQLALVAPELARYGARATAAGVAPNDFDASLRAGSELGYIVAVPRFFFRSCSETEALIAVAPWLTGSAGAVDFSAVVSPLVETRPVAVAIPGRAGFALSGDGSIRVLPPQPTAPAQPSRVP